MTNIVERLREAGENDRMRWMTGPDLLLMTEAADEIERLHTRLRQALAEGEGLAVVVGELKAENAALLGLLADCREYLYAYGPQIREDEQQLLDRLNAALAKEEV